MSLFVLVSSLNFFSDFSAFFCNFTKKKGSTDGENMEGVCEVKRHRLSMKN